MSANGRLDPAVWDEAEMWAMQQKINEMVAKIAALHVCSYTWVGNPETGEWSLEVSAP